MEEERISEAAGVNSAAGSFGLSFGLAVAGGILLAVLSFSFSQQVQGSAAIPAAEQQQITAELEDDAEVMSNTQLGEQITGQPPAVEEAVLDINALARDRSLQVALLVPSSPRSSDSPPRSAWCGCPTPHPRHRGRAWPSGSPRRIESPGASRITLAG